jgi:hypothetical protein
MHPTPPHGRPDDEVPPPLAVLAGTLGWIGCAMHVVAALPLWYAATGFVQMRLEPVIGLDGGGDAADIAVTVVAALLGAAVAGGIPVALGVGASRLLSGRGRGLLIAASLPLAAVVLLLGVQVLAGDPSPAWLLIVLAGPALTPLVAALPSVGRWVARGGTTPGRRPRTAAGRP